MKSAAEKNVYLAFAEVCKANGYRCFLYEEGNYLWMYVITPKSCIYIDEAEFGGYELVYKYIPSGEAGTGCQCMVTWNLEANDIAEAEYYGEKFTVSTKVYDRCPTCGRKTWINKSFKPKHYASGMEALKAQYFYRELVEI